MAFYEGIDKKFYDAGTHYRPMNQFLLNQDETVPTPVEEETEVTTSYGIPNTNKFVISGDGGGGGGSGGQGCENLGFSQILVEKLVWRVLSLPKGKERTLQTEKY